jgi:hypothetical protein
VVNNTTKTVYVRMTADVSPLFPEFLQVRLISAWGEAEVRIERRQSSSFTQDDPDLAKVSNVLSTCFAI